MKLLSLIIGGILLACWPVRAENPVEVSAFTRYDRNGKLEALIEFDIQSGWHIFAPYEQEFGAPLTFSWRLPENATILEESFSRPERFNQDMFSFDGYAQKAFYKTTIQTSDKFEEIPLTISWQACAEECVPASKELLIKPTDSLIFSQKLDIAAQSFVSKDYLPQTNWAMILLMAFAGGLILNLMPCIFPILSIKILSLLQLSEAHRRMEAVFYSLGVIASMLIMATVLFFIRQFDTDAGWGFQLQSPWFVGFMLGLFIILTLLMADLISFNSGWLNRLAVLQFKEKRLNAFMTGLLAVLIASPCTAPFMGAAIGYALIAPAYIYFPVFMALGMGYALPFALLAWYPKTLYKLLPKAGNWMNSLKKILSIPLMLTCLWLAWVLATQLGWIASGKNLQWKEYSSAQVEEALARKQPVFIDFTAKWCITCLVNKEVALQSDGLAELVKEKNILLLRADATSQDAEVSRGLKSYGRASVPLYIYYDGKSDDYLILPQILTPDILSDYLQ